MSSVCKTCSHSGISLRFNNTDNKYIRVGENNWLEISDKLNFLWTMNLILLLKRIKYEIRLGKPNRPLGEPNRPMSTSPKKVEPILRVGPWQDEGPNLPLTFQETCSARMKGLFCKDERLALQGWEACSARMRGLLYKERRQDLTTIKRPQHPHKKVRA